MNYAVMPLAERIQYAAEYAVILKDDPLQTPDQIIEEIAAIFYLSYAEATTAYEQSKKQFSLHYEAATKVKNRQYLIWFVATLACSAFYLLMSTEPGFVFFSIYALFFFFSLVGIMHIAVKNLSENLVIKFPALSRIKQKPFIEIFFAISFFLMISFFQIQFGSIIQQKDIEEKKFTLERKIIKKKAGSKRGYWYYDFHFKNYKKAFRFDEFDYEYASTIPDFENYKPGDTVAIEILKEDVKKLNTKNFFSKNNRIIGVKINNKSIIDYVFRYKQIDRNHKRWFYFLSLALLINIFIIALSLRYAKKDSA